MLNKRRALIGSKITALWVSVCVEMVMIKVVAFFFCLSVASASEEANVEAKAEASSKGPFINHIDIKRVGPEGQKMVKISSKNQSKNGQNWVENSLNGQKCAKYGQRQSQNGQKWIKNCKNSLKLCPRGLWTSPKETNRAKKQLWPILTYQLGHAGRSHPYQYSLVPPPPTLLSASGLLNKYTKTVPNKNWAFTKGGQPYKQREEWKYRVKETSLPIGREELELDLQGMLIIW